MIEDEVVVDPAPDVPSIWEGDNIIDVVQETQTQDVMYYKEVYQSLQNIHFTLVLILCYLIVKSLFKKVR